MEASSSLRKTQHERLCGDNPLAKSETGYESISKHSNDLKIVWAEDLRLLPHDSTKAPFVVAHEFFDALPIHVFQSAAPSSEASQHSRPIQTPTGPIPGPKKAVKENQWRELLVSPKAPHRLQGTEAEFELTLSRAATPHAMYLPETSPRYRNLKQQGGATIEISPESQAHIRDLAVRLGGSDPESSTARKSDSAGRRGHPSTAHDLPLAKQDSSGAILIVDYGPPSSIPAHSLRGIRAHQRVSPFSSAGAVDLSADVDFMALAQTAIDSSPGVEVHGPVDQARFLTAMGIEERAAQLVKRAVEKERGGPTGQVKGELTELVKRVESGWKRLVDRSPQGMGRLYQAMAIIPHIGGNSAEPRRRPVGFGGDIAL